MNAVKSYFKQPPDRSTSSTGNNILFSDSVKFMDNTADTSVTEIHKLLSVFYNKLQDEVNSTLPIEMSSSSRVSRVIIPNSYDEYMDDITSEVSKNPNPKGISTMPSVNKTRKNRPPELDNGDDEDAKGTATLSKSEEDQEEEEESTEDTRLVNDILSNRHMLDNGYMVIPETRYYINNRAIFARFLEKLFHKHTDFIKDAVAPSCDTLRTDNQLSLLIHQQLISEYINVNTPYRGLLLFHGLGSGKTCSSIAISEQFKNTNKRVFILTPASLAPNYEKELKKCGNIIYRLNNNWQWVAYEQLSRQSNRLEHEMYLPRGYIKKNGGVWIILDKATKTVGKTGLNSVSRKKSITAQISAMIAKKYTFIHYNGINRVFMKTFTENYTINPFDNSIVIIDEAHRFINAVVNNLKRIPKNNSIHLTEKSQKPLGVSLQMYNYLVSSVHSRMILLTGTPMVNSPNELSVMFNIIKGLIRTYEGVLTIHTTDKITTDSIVGYLKTTEVYKYINYIKYEPSTKKMVVVLHEEGFVNVIGESPSDVGVTYDDTTIRPIPEILKQIKDTLSKYSIMVPKLDEQEYKNLPDSYDEFMTRFYSNKHLVNTDQLKTRIYGLTSYYSGIPELLPKYNDLEDYQVMRIEMSQYQFGAYIKAREPEQQHEKNRSALAGKDLFKEQSSTYRINSRLACNFVIPDDILSSRSKSTGPTSSEMDELVYKSFDSEYVENVDEDTDLTKEIKSIRSYILDNRSEYLSISGLHKFGPKLASIITHLLNPEHVGLHLVYSQFRHLSGLEILGMAMEENGFAEFKIVNTSTGWQLDISPENMAKPKFAFYTGKEPAIVKEILLNIYNGFLFNIPKELATQLESISPHNNYGELIKVFMITASGAEGIDLKNTRFVHLMESYWNMVRIDQVIGRAVRICSHKNLLPEHQNVKAFLYLTVFPDDQISKKNPNQIMMKDISRLGDTTRPVTTDEFLFETATIKHKIMSQLVTIIKETSIDCPVYPNNRTEHLVCYKPRQVDPKLPYTYEPDYSQEIKQTRFL